MFDATLDLRQGPIGAWALVRLLGSYPFMTLKVIGAIHWQALRLWLKGTPVYRHASRTTVAAAKTT